MAECIRARGAYAVSSGAHNVIVCDSCRRVVAEDAGRPIDHVLVILAVYSHYNYPIIPKIARLEHRIETVDLKTGTSMPGLHLEKKYTD